MDFRFSSQGLLVILLCGFAITAQAADGFYSESSTPMTAARDIASADFDNDTLEDAVVVHGRDSIVDDQTPTFFLQNISTGLSLPISGSGAGLVGNRVAAADFNNDGNIDLVISGGDRLSSGGTVSYINSATAVYFNTGNWTSGTGFDFNAPTVLGSPEYAPELTVGDIDGDLDIDIIVARNEFNVSSTSGTITIWVNQGGIQGGSLGTFSARPYQEANGPYSEVTALTLANLSLLSQPDLIISRDISNIGSTSVHIALNDGAGNFSTQTSGLPYNIDLGAVRVNDANLIGRDYLGLAIGKGARSAVYQIIRATGSAPTDYSETASLGLNPQNIQRVIATNALGTGDSGLVLIGDFDSDPTSGTAATGVYTSPSPGVYETNQQCLLDNISLARAGVNLATDPIEFSAKDDLLILSDNQLYRLFNNANPVTSQCCTTNLIYIQPFVSFDTRSSPAVREADERSPAVWLDSFNTLVQLRTSLMPQTPGGQRYAAHYATHESQLLDIFIQDPAVANTWKNVLSSWNPAMQSLIDHTDDQYILSGMQMADLQTYLQLLEPYAGVGDTVTAELALLAPLNSYAGGSLRDFRQATIGLDAIFSDGFEQ